jgi:hypothetical protein
MKIKILILSAACALFPCLVGAQNIVRNGSFESTDLYGEPLYWSPVGMLLGWENAPDGRNYAYVGSVSQTLATTPGQSYTLSCYAAGDLYASSTSTLEVDWGGHATADFTTQSHPYNSGVNRYLQIVWQRFSVTVTANSSSTPLTFQAINNTGLLLDYVQVVPVPEPSTTTIALP